MLATWVLLTSAECMHECLNLDRQDLKLAGAKGPGCQPDVSGVDAGGGDSVPLVHLHADRDARLQADVAQVGASRIGHQV